jgi:hypothetical protein
VFNGLASIGMLLPEYLQDSLLTAPRATSQEDDGGLLNILDSISSHSLLR